MKKKGIQRTTLLILSIMYLLFSVHMFFTSIHNIDVCQNDLRIQEIVYRETGHLVELNELTVTMDEVGLRECYLQGLKWSIYSIYLIITSSILIGYHLRGKK